jgi:hypothetical protein
MIQYRRPGSSSGGGAENFTETGSAASDLLAGKIGPFFGQNTAWKIFIFFGNNPKEST